MFGFTVGFPGSADRMAPLPVGPNPRWRLAANLENFFMFGSSIEFLGSRQIEWRYFRQIEDGQPPC